MCQMQGPITIERDTLSRIRSARLMVTQLAMFLSVMWCHRLSPGPNHVMQAGKQEISKLPTITK